MTNSTWVVGSSGQLGSALVRRLTEDAATTVISRRIDWANSTARDEDLRTGLEEWLSVDGATAFNLIWAAGAAVTSTGVGSLEEETNVFKRFLHLVGESVRARGLAADTSLFLASSAGGIYAGASPAPFTEQTIPAPVSPYGEAKLEMEETVRRLVRDSGIRALIGRISNLYGPGQRISKPQGFVSQLCKSMLYRTPFSVYVPLDTMRDYVYTDDAAEIILASLERLGKADPGTTLVKNIASQVPTTLGHILHEARVVFKRKPDVILASSALAAGQVMDLRIESTVWTDLNDLPRRSLLVGLAETRAGMELQLRVKGIEYR
ncbi:NAD-dependent epimerase/dehydratase family protein [Lacisediminihabitans sp.]|jgi:UDP-glucose 4-epimerase|uniref:NAD-dependent epimerase/dehydratase family protein n=1 Tax=Lacisediminihabitans sp. TaxID=2787631 RepID=UPI002F95970C